MLNFKGITSNLSRNGLTGWSTEMRYVSYTDRQTV